MRTSRACGLSIFRGPKPGADGTETMREHARVARTIRA
jgi:hypothetical protein